MEAPEENLAGRLLGVYLKEALIECVAGAMPALLICPCRDPVLCAHITKAAAVVVATSNGKYPEPLSLAMREADAGYLGHPFSPLTGDPFATHRFICHLGFGERGGVVFSLLQEQTSFIRQKQVRLPNALGEATWGICCRQSNKII